MSAPEPNLTLRPDAAQMVARAGKLLEVARSLKIVGAEDRQLAASTRAAITGARKTLEEERVALVKPLNDHVRMINDSFRRAQEPLEQAVEIIDAEIKRDAREQERIAAEARRKAEDEARRAREAAEAEARRKREEEAREVEARTRREAFAAGMTIPEVREIAALERADVEAKPLEIAPTAAPTYVPPPRKTTRAETGATTTVKKVWTYQLRDLSKVPTSYLVLDSAKVRAAIRDGVRDIPGIEIYQDEQVAGR